MNIVALTWIAYAITGVIYMAIIYYTFESMFNLRFKRSVTVCVYALLYLSDIALVFSGIEVMHILSSIIFFSIFIFLYVGNIKSRISMAIFIYIAAYLADFLSGYATILIAQTPIEHITFGTTEFFYGLLASKTLLVVFAKIISNITKHRKIAKLTTMHWISLIITPAGSIFVLYYMMFSLIRTNSTLNITGMISSVIIVIINFIVINVYGKILADYEATFKNRILEEQIKYYDYQYFLVEASEKMVSKTKHDIKNFLISLQADLRDNDIHNAQKHLNELLGDIDSVTGLARSGNIAIDAIINFKATIAKEQHITFSLDLQIPDTLVLDSTVICLILGNALDNAIEATDNVKDVSKKIVHIYMSYKQKTLFLRIINPFEGEIIKNNKGGILSSKRDFKQEGMGLQSIINTLGHDDGTLDITYNGNEFCLSVALFGVREQSYVSANS